MLIKENIGGLKDTGTNKRDVIGTRKSEPLMGKKMRVEEKVRGIAHKGSIMQDAKRRII